MLSFERFFTRALRFLRRDEQELSRKDSFTSIIEKVGRREDINEEQIFLVVQSTCVHCS